MFACPCCGKQTIGVFAKLLCSSRYPAICRACGAEVYKAADVRKVQLVLSLCFAAIAGLYPGPRLAAAMAGAIVVVGLLGPLRGMPRP